MTVEIVSGSIDLEKVEGLLFDVDGTLSDTDDQMVQQISEFFDPLAWLFKDQDPHDFSRRLVMLSETPANFLYHVADRLGIDAVIAMVYNWLVQNRSDKTIEEYGHKLIPGVKEMLEALSGQFPMAIVSARDAHTTMRFLKFFELLPYFDAIVTSQTCRYTKPFPDPVEHAAEQLGLPADACLMIGDTIVDVLSGKNAGAQTLAVLCGFGTQRELQRAEADLILSSTADLLKILQD